MESLLKPREAAAALGLTEHTLRNWRYTGGGPPYIKLGFHVRYRPSAIEAWLAQRERRHTAEETGQWTSP